MNGWEFLSDDTNGDWPCTASPDTLSITDVFTIDPSAESDIQDFELGLCNDRIWKDEWKYQELIFERIAGYVSN